MTQSILGPRTGSIWRHGKTGGYYVVLGGCRIEASNEAGVRYRRLFTDQLPHRDPAAYAEWVRPLSEFLDGRFTEITELPLVGRDQALIDTLRGQIAELSSELRLWKSRCKEAELELGARPDGPKGPSALPDHKPYG